MKCIFSTKNELSRRDNSTPVLPIGSGKGQLYSSDALLSLVVFAFALALISGLNFQLITQMDASNQTYLRDASMSRIMSTLLSSPGDPVYWESLSDRNAVKQIGLVDHHAGISRAKWNAFVDWNGDDYSSLKNGMGTPGHDFYITISDVNRTVLAVAGTGPIDVNNVSVITYPSRFNEQVVMVQLQVYRP